MPDFTARGRFVYREDGSVLCGVETEEDAKSITVAMNNHHYLMFTAEGLVKSILKMSFLGDDIYAHGNAILADIARVKAEQDGGS